MSERQYATEPGWYWIKWPGQFPVIKYLDEVNDRLRMNVEGEWCELPLRTDVRGPLENPFDGPAPMQKQIEEAVKKERDRCAKVAENHTCSAECKDCGMGPDCVYVVADAIQNGKES